ncbi:TetR/AcrR family transcriptional regulator [Antarctobacter heliothermus]|uniref:Transcriptional regulator, TetR family n=1 Tax=Antarctobacter heliothermus TaxID=74033 RepID=A0A239JH85_9RHOB|nr:TetR/AcrR family transcriptional regulator [Antarctobacter heliothermus]SNT05159.1 transcriptional regulator, TetR family [Antarctobacter heliothermus]
MARPIAKDHDEKRAQILNTAAHVFAVEGYDRASMNQIAAACGISKANIYHYYAGKDAMLFDLLDNYLSELRNRVCTPPETGATPEDRLLQTVRAVLRAYQGADDHHRVQVSALDALPEDKQKILRAYQRDMVAHLSGILAEVSPDDLGRDARKLRSVTMSVFGMLNWYYMWNSGAGSEAREDYAQLVTNLSLKGLHGL